MPTPPTPAATYLVGAQPVGFAINNTHLYVANRVGNSISKITLAGGAVTTIGSGGNFNGPSALALGQGGVAAGLLFVADSGNNRIRIINTANDSIEVTTIVVGETPVALAINDTHLYVANEVANTISKINLTSLTVTETIGSGGNFNGPSALALDAAANLLYVADAGNNRIRIINTNDDSLLGTTIAVGTTPRALAINATHLYVANYNETFVSRILLSNGSRTDINIPTGAGPGLAGLALDSTYLYVTEYGHNEVAQVLLSDTSQVKILNTGNGSLPYALAVQNNFVFVAKYGAASVSKYSEDAFSTVCFLEGSQILTDEGYRAIEDLRVGDKVKTLHAGYKAIAMIGSSVMYNDATPSRTREKLYVYPEGVVLTGGHSVLKETCTQEEFARIKKSFGRVFVTEGRIRLAAMDDDRASVYPVRGRFNIYNFALEAPHDNMNYGVYAGNGLLVESSFKYWLEKAMNVTAASVEDKARVSFVESV